MQLINVMWFSSVSKDSLLIMEQKNKIGAIHHNHTPPWRDSLHQARNSQHTRARYVIWGILLRLEHILGKQ